MSANIIRRREQTGKPPAQEIRPITELPISSVKPAPENTHLYRATPMADYEIDPEIQHLLPHLDEEERLNLETAILKSRHVDPGVVAIIGGIAGGAEGCRVLADGHNRKSICADHGIPFPVRYLTFPDRESVIEWIINNQLSRRNLSDERKSYYRGKDFLNTRKSKGNPQFPHNEGIVSELGEAAEKVAKKHGVGRATVERDVKFAEAVDALPKEDAEIVLSGKSGMTKSEVANGKTLILCDRCQRTGTVKDCANCVEARKAARKAARKPKKAADVETPVAEPEPVEIPCDGNGVPWTGASLIAIKAETQFVEMGRQLSKMAKVIAETESLHLYSYSMQSVVASLKTVRSTLLDALPAYFCPYCDGTLKTVEGREKGKACEVCCRQGWVGKSTYKRSPKGASK